MNAWILRTLGATGTLLFSALFFFTFQRPAWVEQAARDFIATEVEEQVGAHVSRIDAGSALVQAAGVLHYANSERIARLESALQSKLHERIAAALVDVRRFDCECRARVAALLQAGMLGALTSLDATNSRLDEFIQGRYLSVVGELARDLRIFTGANALACLSLLLLSFARPRAVNHLVLPGVLLAVAVAVSSYCYLFEQNWLFTIVFSDYFGVAYLGLLTFVFGLLLDVFLNRGRYTTRLGNWGLGIVGSAFTLSVC
jgi:hypothetical protein